MGTPGHSGLRRAFAASAAALTLAACGGSDAIADTLPATDDAAPASTAPPSSTAANAATASTLGSAAAPTTESDATSTQPTTESTTAATTAVTEPAATPAGYVEIRTEEAGEGLRFVIPESFDEIDSTAPFGAQADALDVDAAGRAGLFALEQLVDQADFDYIGFNFNTGSDRTDNVLAIRYPIASAPSPANLAEIYSTQTLNGGGEITSAEVITVDGRDGVSLRLATAIDGQLLVDQAIVLVYGDDALHELTITVARPASAEALDRIATIIDNIRYIG